MAFEFKADRELRARFRDIRGTANWLHNVKFPSHEGGESTYDTLQRELEGLRAQNSVLNSRRDYIFSVPPYRVSHYQQEGETQEMAEPQEFPQGILALHYLGSQFSGASLSTERLHPHQTDEMMRVYFNDHLMRALCLGDLYLENLSPAAIAEKIIANLQIMNLESLAQGHSYWKSCALGQEEQEEEEEEEEYDWHCYRCEEGQTDDDTAIETVSGDTICRYCFDEYQYTYCYSCECATRHTTEIDGENYCRECAKNANTCDNCNSLTFAAVTHVSDDKNVCDDCKDCREESAPTTMPIPEIVNLKMEVLA